MSSVRKIKGYGWKPQLPDLRDHEFKPAVTDVSQLPTVFSLRDKMPPIYDQGQLGSCVSNGTAGIFEHQAMSEGEGEYMPSRLFIYYEGRRLEGDPISEDTGLEVRTGIKVVVSDGAPVETDWPYDIGKFAQKPPQKAYTDAQAHHALEYQTVVPQPGVPAMRSAIMQGLPIVFGFPVPSYFETYDAANDMLRLPHKDDQFVGGHCTVVIGWDFSLRRFKVPVFEVRNSWGPDWGDAGHFWMHYRWFPPSKNLASDLWVIQKVA